MNKFKEFEAVMCKRMKITYPHLEHLVFGLKAFAKLSVITQPAEEFEQACEVFGLENTAQMIISRLEKDESNKKEIINLIVAINQKMITLNMSINKFDDVPPQEFFEMMKNFKQGDGDVN